MTNDITNVNRAIANIDNSIATAEDCVMESFVTLDKKYTAMEKRGMELTGLSRSLLPDTDQESRH